MLGIGWEEPEHLFPEQMGDATVRELSLRVCDLAIEFMPESVVSW